MGTETVVVALAADRHAARKTPTCRREHLDPRSRVIPMSTARDTLAREMAFNCSSGTSRARLILHGMLVSNVPATTMRTRACITSPHTRAPSSESRRQISVRVEDESRDVLDIRVDVR